MNLIKKYYISLIWMVIMCYLLFSPSGGLPKGNFINLPHKDKIIHWGMFGVMTLIFLFENERNKQNLLKASMLIILWGLLFGGLSEYIQYTLVAERKGSFFDFLADVTGTAMAIAGYFLIVRKYILQKILS